MLIELARGVAFLLALCTIQSFITLALQRHPTACQIVSGLAYGCISVIGMMVPIELDKGHILDARSVVLAVSGLISGPLAGGVAAVVGTAYRGYLGGDGAPVGIVAIIAAVVLGLFFREMARRGWIRMAFPELLVFGFVVHLVIAGLFSFLPEPIRGIALDDIAMPMIAIFTPSTALLAMMLNLFLDHFETRQSLKEANYRFHQITQNIHEVFYITNPERTELIYVNPAFETVWGRSCESLHQKPRLLFDTVHPEDLDGVEAMTARYRHEEFEHSYRIIRPDGVVRTIRSKAFPIRNEDGEVYRIAGFVEDVTELEGRRARRRHAEKMESIGQLSGGVAHDFNNMLGGIIGYAEMIERRSGGDVRVRNSASKIVTAVNRASELTGKLLAFSRKGTMISDPTDLHHSIGDALALLESGIDRRITITRKCDAQYSTAIGDPGELQNMFLNFGVNARDAMPDGGVLTIATKNVELDQAYCETSSFPLTPGLHMDISISDTGVGIDETIMDRIFDPFFTTKEVGKGTGLGLAAIYGSVRDHKGEVTVSSELGKGTVFRVLLPVSPEHHEDQRKPWSPVSHGFGTILLIDDEELLREAGADVLEELGYQAIIAANGSEGVEMYRRNSEQIDLVILDMVMPKMSGADTFRAIRAIDPTAKVILASGFAEDLEVAGLRDEGLAGFLKKPYRLSALSQTVADCLNS